MSIVRLDSESGVMECRERPEGDLISYIPHSADCRLPGSTRWSIMYMTHISALTTLLDPLIFRTRTILSSTVLPAVKTESYRMVNLVGVVSSLYKNGYIKRRCYATVESCQLPG